MNPLKLHTVVVTQSVPLHSHEPGEPCGPSCANSGFTSETWGTARYTVDIASGDCEGVVDHITFVDPVWWKEHCARVGKRVAERLKDIKL